MAWPVDHMRLIEAECPDEESDSSEVIYGPQSGKRGIIGTSVLLLVTTGLAARAYVGGHAVAKVRSGDGLAPLQLVEQECHGVEASLQPGVGDEYLWRCFTGQCIDAWLKCDGKPDCVDGSDEGYACPQQQAAPQPQAAPQQQFAPQQQQPFVPQQQGAPQAQQMPPPQQGAPASAGCTQKSNYQYLLDWKAEGESFFSEWNYLQTEPNSGAAEYVLADEAQAAQMVQAGPTVAVIKPGGPGNAPMKRKSVKMETSRKWTYFLMAMKYEAMPWGCGVWPALWTHSPDAGWPAGGELDILEYSNEITSRTSLHTAESNRCQLNGALLNKPGCPSFVDAEYDFTGKYECVTAYPEKIGCAPNDRSKMLNGEQMSNDPGVVAVEWTPDFIKIFRIPQGQIPADLTADSPQPDNWDQWITGYYPFAESEATIPGSCPNPAGIMKAQQIVLSLGFCGDWASKVYSNSTCANTGIPAKDAWSCKGPVINQQCVAVDPHDPKGEQPAGPRDCCTNFIADPQGQFGTQQYLDEHGAWKINYMKVYQSQQAMAR